MSYLREVATVLKQRFPNLTVDDTLDLTEQLTVLHDRRLAVVTATFHDALEDLAATPGLATDAKAAVRVSLERLLR